MHFFLFIFDFSLLAPAGNCSGEFREMSLASFCGGGESWLHMKSRASPRRARRAPQRAVRWCLPGVSWKLTLNLHENSLRPGHWWEGHVSKLQIFTSSRLEARLSTLDSRQLSNQSFLISRPVCCYLWMHSPVLLRHRLPFHSIPLRDRPLPFGRPACLPACLA